MANVQNLKPFTSEQSREKAKENGKKGGIASGIAKREKKMLKDTLKLLLEQEVGVDKDGNPIDAQTAMATKAVQEAIKGDWKAWELVRDTTGQKPVEKMQVEQVDRQATFDELKELFAEDDE